LELLDAAKPLATRPSWLRSAARMDGLRCDTAMGRRHGEELLKEEPLAIDAYRNLSRVIADLEGRDAAVAWVKRASDRHATYYPIQQLLIDWLRGEPPPETSPGQFPAEPIIRRLIDLCPEDAWAHREYALHLANHGRPEEGAVELEIARKLDPESPSYFY